MIARKADTLGFSGVVAALCITSGVAEVFCIAVSATNVGIVVMGTRPLIAPAIALGSNTSPDAGMLTAPAIALGGSTTTSITGVLTALLTLDAPSEMQNVLGVPPMETML